MPPKVAKSAAAALSKVAPPKNWQKLYNAVIKMRLMYPAAPVDVIGCHMLKDKHATVEDQRWQTLVALMLSSQTKDQMTYLAMKNLIALPFGCSVKAIAAAKEDDVHNAITMVGMHNKKVVYIQRTAKQILEKHNGLVPGDLTALLALPGVGPKMAHLFLQCSDEKLTGIGVDVHVHRIVRERWSWVPPKVKAVPEDTRKELERWLPKEHWAEINELLVGFGQTVCTPRFPLCHACTARDICPAAFKEASPAQKKAMEQTKKANGGVLPAPEEWIKVATQELPALLELKSQALQPESNDEATASTGAGGGVIPPTKRQRDEDNGSGSDEEESSDSDDTSESSVEKEKEEPEESKSRGTFDALCSGLRSGTKTTAASAPLMSKGRRVEGVDGATASAKPCAEPALPSTDTKKNKSHTKVTTPTTSDASTSAGKKKGMSRQASAQSLMLVERSNSSSGGLLSKEGSVASLGLRTPSFSAEIPLSELEPRAWRLAVDIEDTCGPPAAKSAAKK